MRSAQRIVPALFAVLLSATSVMAQQPLTDSELKIMLVGHSSTFSDGGVAEYNTDGTYSFKSPNGKVFNGKWTIAGGRVCYEFAGGGNRCDTYFKDASGPYLLSARGNQYRFSTGDLGSSSAIAGVSSGTLNACEHSLPYTLQTPAADVPAPTNGFSGVWVGKWDVGLCAALAVESITSTGNVRFLYTNGSLPQMHVNRASGRYNGQMKGGKLEFSRNGVSMEFRLQDPTHMAGTYSSSYGQFSGSFQKQ